MAPQQELQKLIPQKPASHQLQPFAGYTSEEVSESTEALMSDAHVIVIQPDSKGKKKPHGGKFKSEAGLEEPRNCRQIETALFFFGVAGMVVSIIMLIQHLLIPYY